MVGEAVFTSKWVGGAFYLLTAGKKKHRLDATSSSKNAQKLNVKTLQNFHGKNCKS